MKRVAAFNGRRCLAPRERWDVPFGWPPPPRGGRARLRAQMRAYFSPWKPQDAPREK